MRRLSGRAAVFVDTHRPAREDIQRLILDEMLDLFPANHAMLCAYLDESGTGDDSPIMCVAGLLFDKDKITRLHREWKKALAKHGISLWHTVEYAHSKGEFKPENRAVHDQLYKELIALIKKYALGGGAIFMVPEKEFERYRKGELGHWWEHSQYTTCVFLCMSMLRDVARRLEDERVVFHIEAGHKNMGELANWLKTVSATVKSVNLWEHWSFHPKTSLVLLQTADVWAYELAKRGRDQILKSGRKMRKSLEILVDGNENMRVLNVDKEMLRFYFRRFSENMLRL